MEKEKIKLRLESGVLEAMRAIVAEFDSCGNVGNILLSAQSTSKNLKLTEEDFGCVLSGVNKAIKSGLYSGNLFKDLLASKEYLEQQYDKQGATNHDS